MVKAQGASDHLVKIFPENMQDIPQDENSKDQFLIQSKSGGTQVLWNNVQKLKSEPVYKNSFVTESLWSPLGTYLANVKKQDIILFRGTSALHHVATCLHPKVFEVKWVDFSPGENYLVSYSVEQKNTGEITRAAISIFDVKTGKVVKKIVGGPHDFASKGVGASWPIFKWSGGRDDKYFALISKNVISIYEINTFTAILTVGNVMDFSWSPTDAILALFVSESVDAGGAIPALVKLVQIPSKEQLIEKKLSSVSKCKMYWQSNGEYLAMKVDSSTNNFVELFQIKDRGIDNKILALPYNKDKVTAFAWEPMGHRFAIIQSNEDISFYSMRDATSTGCVSLLTILRSKGTNYLFWSPSGGLIILARLNGSNGNLEFFNVDELRTVAISKHIATALEWNPTGRYVATSTPGTCHEKPSFNIWSFDGHLLYQLQKDLFTKFSWRPRPLNMATKAIMGSMSHNSLHSLNMEDDEYSLNMEDDEYSLNMEDDDNSMSLTGGIKKSVAFMEKFHEDLDAFYRLDDEERQLLIDLKYLTLSPASQKPKEKDVVIVISDDEEEEKHVLMNLKYLASSSTSKKPEGADVVIGISDEEEKMALQPSSPKKTLPMAGQTKERRFHRKWTKEEEEALRHGYKKYKTNWKLILGDPAYKACHGRTNVDLKDKWRNLMRADDRAKAKACYSLPKLGLSVPR